MRRTRFEHLLSKSFSEISESGRFFPSFVRRFGLPCRAGHVYYAEHLGLEGWLCPALLRYYPEAPKQLFVQTKSQVLPDGA